MNKESVRNLVGETVIQKTNDLPRENSIDALNEDNFTRIKLKINNLLWEELSAKTTMEEAEKAACQIMSILLDLKIK